MDSYWIGMNSILNDPAGRLVFCLDCTLLMTGHTPTIRHQASSTTKKQLTNFTILIFPSTTEQQPDPNGTMNNNHPDPYMTLMLSSYHHSDSDSDSISTITTIESSRCHERKPFEQLKHIHVPEQRFVNTSSKEAEIISLRKTVERLLGALEEKEADITSSRSRNTMKMKRLTARLQEQAEEVLDMQKVHANALQKKEEEILDMQEAHEAKMLDMLKLKLSNYSTSTSISCHCHGKSSSSPSQGNDNNCSSSFQREVSVSKASETEANAKQRPQKESNKMSWCKIKSEVSSCGRSMLSKFKIKASIPKEVNAVSFLNASDVDNLSNLTS